MLQFLTRKTEEVRRGEMFSYASGVFGAHMNGMFISGFILFYMTDYVKVAPVLAGILMFIPRIWDAINDPMMGIVADRTRTRFGRFRPYLGFMPFILFLITLFLYSVPGGLTYTQKVVWTFSGYFIWGMAYTAVAIPNESLVAVVTKDEAKRAKIISLSKFASMLGGGIPMLLVGPLAKSMGEHAFRNMALIFGAITMITMFISFLFTRERVHVTQERVNLKKSFSMLLKNKPLLLLAAMGILSSLIIWTSSALRMYFLKYNLGNEGLLAYFTLGMLPFNVLGFLIAPIIIKKFTSIKSFIFACGFRIFFSAAFFMIGNQSIISAIIWMGLVDVSLAVEGIAIVNMIIDCVDYGEYRFGKRTEGLYFSIQSFAAKMAGSLSTLISGFALAIVGYIPEVPQSPQTLKGIFFVFSAMPGIAAVVSLLVMWMYPLKGKFLMKMRRELEERKEIA